MKTEMLKMARRLFNVSYVPQEINRANQRKWARSVKQLGSNWLLAKYVGRLDESRT